LVQASFYFPPRLTVAPQGSYLVAYSNLYQPPVRSSDKPESFITSRDERAIARYAGEATSIKEDWGKKLANTLSGLTADQKKAATEYFKDKLLGTQVQIDVLAKHSTSKKILAVEKGLYGKEWQFDKKGQVTEFPGNLYPGNVRHGTAGDLFDGIKRTLGDDGTIAYLEIHGHGNANHFSIGGSLSRGGGLADKSPIARQITTDNGDYIADELARFKYDKGTVIIFSGCKVGGGRNDPWLQIVADQTGAEVRAPRKGVGGWSINGNLQGDPDWKVFRPRGK
jgi:hypothetical protein